MAFSAGVSYPLILLMTMKKKPANPPLLGRPPVPPAEYRHNVTVRLPARTIERLERACRATAVTRTAFIEQAIEERLAKMKRMR